MTRRMFLASAALLPAAARARLGIATTSYLGFRRPKDTLEFLEHCHSLGAAGIQAPLTSLEDDYLKRLERRAKDLGMYIEVMAGLPRAEMKQFVATVEAAKRIGALCVRAACLGGRRYETFDTISKWQQFVTDSHAALARAVPVLEKNRFPLALENHKDWTADEMVSLLKKYDSPYLGACLDTGNNIALLDDPMDLVQKLLPFTISTHIKDMGVAPYEDGFLLSEVVVGKGMLDIPKIVSMVPAKAKLTLEMITRDPLKVPALTEKYWVTFPERSGVYLARTMRMVEAKTSKLPVVSGLAREEQIRVEEQNVRDSMKAVV
jgi:sugar phosphate isomerase/epimerase